MYAIALPYWSVSSHLQTWPRPDLAFAWNQAVIALNEDFEAPSITTLLSVLLDLSGRPSLEMRYNLINVGRAVCLARSLGLHRDPTNWQVPEAEKHFRANLWWTVLIHDFWSSLTHGTPPNVHGDTFDVPLPKQISSTNSFFFNLCSLTQILGRILPLMYTLRPMSGDMWKGIEESRSLLGNAEHNISAQSHEEYSETCSSNGMANLWFNILSLRLVLDRLALRVGNSPHRLGLLLTISGYSTRTQHHS